MIEFYRCHRVFQPFHHFALKKLSFSTAVTVPLPKLKSLEVKNRERLKLPFQKFLIENLFINKLQFNVLEYPQLNTLKEVNLLYENRRQAQNLLSSHTKLLESSILGIDSGKVISCIKELELTGFKAPLNVGGFGYLSCETSYLQEALCEDLSLSKTITENENFGVEIISRFGSDVQKEKYLKKLVSGEYLACFAHSEENKFASLDPCSTKTEAVLLPNGNSYLVSGKKNWVFNAKHSDLIIFSATVATDNEESKKENTNKKITLFLVDKTLNGIFVHEPVQTIGLKGVEISEVTFDQVVVPSSSILGVINEGDAIVKHIFCTRELSNSVQCVAIMKKLVDSIMKHCYENKYFKQYKFETDSFRIRLGYLIGRIYNVESMAYLVAGRMDAFDEPDLFYESIILKIFSSETLRYVLHEALDIIGTDKFSVNYQPLEKIIQDSQIFTASDYSNNYLRLILGKAGCKHFLKHQKTMNPFTRCKVFLKEINYLRGILIRRMEFIAGDKFEGYLHLIYQKEAKFLEDMIYRLYFNMRYLYRKLGPKLLNSQRELIMSADIAVDIYSLVALLARANRAYCLAMRNQEVDKTITYCETRRLHIKVFNNMKLIQEKSFSNIADKAGTQILGSQGQAMYHPILGKETTNLNEMRNRHLRRSNEFTWRNFMEPLIQIDRLEKMKFLLNSFLLLNLREWNGMAMQNQSLFKSYMNEAKEKFLKDYSVKILPKTSFADYEFTRVLGQGSYGQVLEAKHVSSGKILAVKIIKKKKIIKEDQLKHLISEIRILNAVKFDYLISLECYFTNECFVFIVMPYVPGGHFLKLLRKIRKFDEVSAKFYGGQVILALEYLHSCGIVYRDLKPENLLIDVNGYLKLIDFGFSKLIRHNFTYTFCGTPEYIAPEIILGKGYSKSPDWWSFGIFLFEMCAGYPPFTSKNELKLYEKILVGNVNFPEHFSSALKSILMGLIQVNKTKRLGCMKNSADDVKFHDWFKNLDWNALWNKQIVPPSSFIPPKRSIPNAENELIEKIFSSSKFNDCETSEFTGNIDNGI